MNHRGLSHSDCQVGAWDFFSGQTVRKLGKLVPCEGSRQHTLPARKDVFYMYKLFDIFDILYQTRVKYVAAKSSHLVCTAHTSLCAWRTQRRSCGITWCGPWGRPRIWIASCTVNCSPPLFRIRQGYFAPPAPPKFGTCCCRRRRWYLSWRCRHCLFCLPLELWGWWHDENAAYLGEFWATQLLWLLSAADEYLNRDPVLKMWVFLWISVFVNFIVAFLRFVFTLSRHGVCHEWYKWHLCKNFWAWVIFSRTKAKNHSFSENCRKHYCLKQAEFFTK